MTSNALDRIEYGDKAAKRATWESFEFSVPATGVVVVKNMSYGDEADEHTHSVNVTDGVPTECSCKSDEFGSSACKHRVAVAINTAVLEAATSSKLLADGGVVPAAEPPELENEDHHAPGCDNPECEGFDADGRPLLSWECWEVWS